MTILTAQTMKLNLWKQNEKKEDEKKCQVVEEKCYFNILLDWFVCACVDLVRFWELLDDWKNKLVLPFRNNNSLSYNEIQSIEIYWMHILCGFFKPNTVASTLRVTDKFSRVSKIERRESECNMLSEMLRVAYHETSATQKE